MLRILGRFPVPGSGGVAYPGRRSRIARIVPSTYDGQPCRGSRAYTSMWTRTRWTPSTLTEGLALPRCLTEEAKPVPCLTTPSDDPQGRPAPRSAKGKISSEATQRWLADKRRYAPWHYESGVMMTDRSQRLVIPPASMKEQWHHLPKGWSASLQDHARHKAVANGWHAGAARLMFIMAVFASTPPTPAAELNPLGGTALDITAALWQGKSPLLGPGPGDYDEFDLSYLEDPDEHWRQSRDMPHPEARDASIKPGLQQWLQVWSRMRPHLTELRLAVATQIEDLVEDLHEEANDWYSKLARRT